MTFVARLGLLHRQLTPVATAGQQREVAFGSERFGESEERRPKVALIFGAGDGLGSAVSRRFAREGYVTVMVRRERHLAKLEALAEAINKEGGRAVALGADARVEGDVRRVVETAEESYGEIAFCCHNIGANVRFPVHDTTEQVFRKVWEMACLSGFLVGREVTRRMAARGTGTMLFSGATASLRGGPGFSAFSSAKHGLRAVAQSMARELGPKGVHVAHVVIDGAIDSPWILENIPDAHALAAAGGLIKPDSIAETYWQIHRQPADCWTHETDLRPHVERW